MQKIDRAEIIGAVGYCVGKSVSLSVRNEQIPFPYQSESPDLSSAVLPLVR